MNEQSIMSANESDVSIIHFLCIFAAFYVIYILEKYIFSTMAELNNTDIIPQVVTSEDIFNALSVMSQEITALSKIVRNKLKVKELPPPKSISKKEPLKKPTSTKSAAKDAKRKTKTA